MKFIFRLICNYLFYFIFFSSIFFLLTCKEKQNELTNIENQNLQKIQNRNPTLSVEKKCEPIWFESLSENPRCYRLQEKLINASSTGDIVQIIGALKLGANVEGAYATSFSALYHASMNGQNNAVELLLDNRAEINRVFNFGQTPLKVSVIEGKIDTVQLLITKGVNICDKTPDEGSALQIAHRLKNQNIINMLNDAGANMCN